MTDKRITDEPGDFSPIANTVSQSFPDSNDRSLSTETVPNPANAVSTPGDESEEATHVTRENSGCKYSERKVGVSMSDFQAESAIALAALPQHLWVVIARSATRGEATVISEFLRAFDRPFEAGFVESYNNRLREEEEILLSPDTEI